MQSYITSTEVNGKAWHRVFVGPFDNRSVMNKVHDKLVTRGISPMELKEPVKKANRSEEHTSELQSRPHLVCRLLLEKKKKKKKKQNKRKKKTKKKKRKMTRSNLNTKHTVNI